MIKSLRIDFGPASWSLFLCLVPPEETINPSSESLISLRNLSPSGKVIGSLADEILSHSGEALGRLFVFP